MKLPKRSFEALSVLDISPVLTGATAATALGDTVELARLVDTLGYRRYWLAEHHNMGGVASSSPEIIISQVAQATKTIRVGSGGIMLPNHTPLKVAEIFRTLEAFHPGRIDLGLGRAPGTGTRTALALRGSQERLGAEDFPREVSELVAFLTTGFPEGHPYRKITAMPDVASVPELWLLGSSDFGARLAGEMGLGYAFAQHFSPLAARDVLGAYRKHFRPSRFLKEPYAIVAVQVVCADTDEQAAKLYTSSQVAFARLRQSGESGPMPSVEEVEALRLSPSEWEGIRAVTTPGFVGSKETVRTALTRFAKDCGLDELMVLTMVHDQAARRHSYELLAELFL